MDNQKGLNYDGYFPTWCPGCGNYGLWGSIKSALKKEGIDRENMAVVYGIGCSGNMNDFLWVNSFHSLHGRAVPSAIGIKLANHNLPVFVVAGDGDSYGEGGNHLIHACRGNHDINLFIHDNRVYGLTTGQVSPTALQGSKSKSTPRGLIEQRLNPLVLALTQGATFVAQGFAGDVAHLTSLMQKAIKHKGFTLLNILQPCVTFNKVQTYDWYRERVYKLEETNYDPLNKDQALEKTMEFSEKIPIGLIYKEDRPVYTDELPQLKTSTLKDANLDIDIEQFASEFI